MTAAAEREPEVQWAPFVVGYFALTGRPDEAGALLVLAGLAAVGLLSLIALGFLWVGVPLRRGVYLSRTGLSIRRRAFTPPVIIRWFQVRSFALNRRGNTEAVVAQLDTGRSIDLPRLARPSTPTNREHPRRAELVAQSLDHLVEELNGLAVPATVIAELSSAFSDPDAMHVVSLPHDKSTLCLIATDIGGTAEPLINQLTEGLHRRTAHGELGPDPWTIWTGTDKTGRCAIAAGRLDRFAAHVHPEDRERIAKNLDGVDPNRCVAVRLTPSG